MPEASAVPSELGHPNADPRENAGYFHMFLRNI